MESFINNEIIEKIIISNAIIKIEKKAFYNMKNLETVIFEEESQLTIIEESAFQNSSNLSNIYLPNGLEIIGENAFKNTGLIDLVVPNTVELIEREHFIIFQVWRQLHFQMMQMLQSKRKHLLMLLI